MIEDIKQDAHKRMQKSIDAFKAELSKIRTGRAHPALLNHVMVDFYGSEVPVGQAEHYCRGRAHAGGYPVGQEHGADHRKSDHDFGSGA